MIANVEVVIKRGSLTPQSVLWLCSVQILLYWLLIVGTQCGVHNIYHCFTINLSFINTARGPFYKEGACVAVWTSVVRTHSESRNINFYLSSE